MAGILGAAVDRNPARITEQTYRLHSLKRAASAPEFPKPSQFLQKRTVGPGGRGHVPRHPTSGRDRRSCSDDVPEFERFRSSRTDVMESRRLGHVPFWPDIWPGAKTTRLPGYLHCGCRGPVHACPWATWPSRGSVYR